LDGRNFMNKIYTIWIILAITLSIHCKKETPIKLKEETQEPSNQENMKKLIFLGDSLTAGMGLPGVEYSYANLLYNRLQSKGYTFKFINAGLSGDTTSGGLTRLDWVLSKGVDIFILELGANDMMRGIQPSEISKNLMEIIERVRKKNPNSKILLIPMKPFPNMGKEYGKKFENVYTDVAKITGVSLSEFLLENVAGIPSLNQKDGIHPTIEGHKIMQENIWNNLIQLVE
jgi:acyl-CoA thioesterase I